MAKKKSKKEVVEEPKIVGNTVSEPTIYGIDLVSEAANTINAIVGNSVDGEKQAEEEVIPASPEQPDPSEDSVEHEEETPSGATLEVVETETVIEVEEDPRYALLKQSLIDLLTAAPTFEKGKENPWLWLEWRNQIANLVQ